MSCGDATVSYSARVEQTRTWLRPLWLNSAFSLGWTVTGEDYSGDELDLVLTNTTTGGRVTLTEADATVSNTDQTVTFAKSAAWTASNLEAGQYEAHVFRNDAHYLFFTFDAVTPYNARISL